MKDSQSPVPSIVVPPCAAIHALAVPSVDDLRAHFIELSNYLVPFPGPSRSVISVHAGTAIVEQNQRISVSSSDEFWLSTQVKISTSY